MNPNIGPNYRPDIPATIALSAAATLLAANIVPNSFTLEQDGQAPRPSATTSQHEVTESHVIHGEFDRGFGMLKMPFAPEFSKSSEAKHVDPADVTRVIKFLETLPKNAHTHIEIAPFASDETAAVPGAGLGEHDPRNQQLADTRGKAFEHALQYDMAWDGAVPTDVTIERLPGAESVLSKPQIAQIDKLAEQNGASREALIDDYNNNRELPASTQSYLESVLGDKRGEMVEVTGTTEHIVEIPVFPVPVNPDQPKRKYSNQNSHELPPFLVIPAYRRREEESVIDEQEERIITDPQRPLTYGTENIPYELPPMPLETAVGKELVPVTQAEKAKANNLPSRWQGSWSGPENIIDVEGWEVPEIGSQLAITTGRLAIEAAPQRLEIEAVQQPLAIEAAPSRLAIEAAPRRLELMPAPTDQ